MCKTYLFFGFGIKKGVNMQDMKTMGVILATDVYCGCVPVSELMLVNAWKYEWTEDCFRDNID